MKKNRFYFGILSVPIPLFKKIEAQRKREGFGEHERIAFCTILIKRALEQKQK